MSLGQIGDEGGLDGTPTTREHDYGSDADNGLANLKVATAHDRNIGANARAARKSLASASASINKRKIVKPVNAVLPLARGHPLSLFSSI
jgi:hypothetical protein